MSTSVSIAGSQVVAAMTPPTSKAPFNRARLIVRAGDGTLVRAQTYTSDGRVEGPALTLEDLQGLVDAGHAVELSASISLVSGASLWVLRQGLPRRDRALQDLQLSGLLVHSPLIGLEDARLCVVKEGDPDAAAMLDRWRDEAMAAAKGHAQQGDWDLARIDVEIAQALCRGLDADVLALLSLAYERCDRAERAAGLLAMARRSRGSEFETQVIRALRHFEIALAVGRSTRNRRRPDLGAALRQRFPIAARELGKSPSARLSPAAA
jgi:hypothetical protein